MEHSQHVTGQWLLRNSSRIGIYEKPAKEQLKQVQQQGRKLKPAKEQFKQVQQQERK